ncbi:hypothetical protein Hanom_Chr04g00377121 [Helianthus anomalus]
MCLIESCELDSAIICVNWWRLGKEAGQTKQEWWKSIIRVQGIDIQWIFASFLISE